MKTLKLVQALAATLVLWFGNITMTLDSAMTHFGLESFARIARIGALFLALVLLVI